MTELMEVDFDEYMRARVGNDWEWHTAADYRNRSLLTALKVIAHG